MSTGQAFASIRTSSALEVLSAVPPQSVKDRDQSTGRGVRLFVPQTTAAASRAGGTWLDQCNR